MGHPITSVKANNRDASHISGHKWNLGTFFFEFDTFTELQAVEHQCLGGGFPREGSVSRASVPFNLEA